MQASTSTPESTIPTRLLSSSFISSARHLLLISLFPKKFNAQYQLPTCQQLCYSSSFLTQSDSKSIRFPLYKYHPLPKSESSSSQPLIFVIRETEMLFITQSLRSYAKETLESTALKL